MARQTLKSGWQVWRFDQLAENVGQRGDPTPDDSKLYVGLDHMDTDSLRVRRWGSKTDLIGQKLRMRKGDILFARRNAYLKRVAIAPHDGLFSAHGLVLRPKADVVLPEFLPFFMQSDVFMDRAIQISVGSLSPTINWKVLATQEFTIPSIQEQRRIVDLFQAYKDTLDTYQDIASSGGAMLLARSLAIFQEEDRTEWQCSKIGEIAEVQYGLTINPKRQNLLRQLPYLRVANAQRFYFDLAEIKEVGVDDKDEGYALRKHDILVVEGHADIFELGRAAIWEDQIPGCLHQNHLIRIRCGERVDPYFVLEYVNSPTGRAYFRQQGKSTSGLNTLNSKVVREMPIPIPSLEIQKAISGELQSARAALEVVATRYQELLCVFKSISTQAFRKA